MQLTDLLLANTPISPYPTFPSLSPVVRAATEESYLVGLQATVQEAFVVEATPVYRYCRTLQATDLYELPCLAPPHDTLMVEWKQENGIRFGALSVARTGPFHIGTQVPAGPVGDNGYRTLRRPDRNPDDFIGLDPETLAHQADWVSDNLPDQAAWDRVRWTWDISIFQEDKHRVVGPIALIQCALDEWGRLIDTTYTLNKPNSTDPEQDTHRFGLGPFMIFAYTINFMQCANIETAYVDPPAALSAKHRKKGRLLPGQNLVRYHVLKVRPMGPRQQARGRPGGLTDLTALHTVRGEFHHYGDCCPGLHPPKGKLFGKWTGRWWWQDHVRGNPTHGVVTKDFAVEAPEVPPS